MTIQPTRTDEQNDAKAIYAGSIIEKEEANASLNLFSGSFGRSPDHEKV